MMSVFLTASKKDLENMGIIHEEDQKLLLSGRALPVLKRCMKEGQMTVMVGHPIDVHSDWSYWIYQKFTEAIFQ